MIKVKAEFLYNTIMKGFLGTTIAPFILYNSSSLNKRSEEKQTEFWNHETTHIKQQYELFIIGFYVLYLYYYLKNLKNGMSKRDAYRNIPFELEANDHENNSKYNNTRKKNAWKLYI